MTYSLLQLSEVQRGCGSKCREHLFNEQNDLGVFGCVQCSRIKQRNSWYALLGIDQGANAMGLLKPHIFQQLISV